MATNAGGMRAVKYGVTRHQVLGLEAVLGTGEIIRTGGRFVKATTGYDLTQLITGSEGTLALVTEATLRLYPRPDFRATVLAPFATLEEVTAAVPPIVASGIGPLMIEYLDQVTMASILATQRLDAGIPEEMQERALAFLVLVVEQRLDGRLDEDVEELAALVAGLGALDVFVLPPHAGARLIEGRERAFWNAKAAGADDIIDMVVPRAAMPLYMSQVAELARNSGRGLPAAVTPGTATCTCPSSSPIRTAGITSSTTSSPPAWRWAEPSPVSMASASGKRGTSRPSRTPPSWPCGGASRRPSIRTTSSTRDDFRSVGAGVSRPGRQRTVCGF